MAEERAVVTSAVKQHRGGLLRFIRGRVPTDADAEDVVQDVFTQLAAQPEVLAIEQVGAWLYRVARNRITDRYRKKKTAALEDFVYEDEEGGIDFRRILIAQDEDPDTRMLRDIFWTELREGLEALPPEQRLVFEQNELQDKTLQQIADEQGPNLKTIISRKRYAVLRLRERLETTYNELVRS